MQHRVRERLVKARTALCNEIRGLLHEYGVVIPLGRARLRLELPRVLEESETLTPTCRRVMSSLYEELVRLDEEVKRYDKELLLSSTGDPKSFKNGRAFAAWLGLVPKQRSSGGKQKLLGISKRGDSYIRKLLVHGARVVMRYISKKHDRRNKWLVQLSLRRGYNRATVALANKNARVIWVLLNRGETYKEYPSAA